jgi:hypothetical protein
MDHIHIAINRICEEDKENFPLGFLYVHVQTGPASVTMHSAPGLCEIREVGLETVTKEYRRMLVGLESQLSKGIEEVRALLENLPATSIKSAPTAPLFADEVVS